ncbi:MAG TPA: hypothetical protein VEI03_20095 [Stellaceae bacterium]|nr:hypothetical protein [Stellaceae bacterium]
MKGGELLRKVQAVGKARGVNVVFDQRHRKGSHGTLFYGARKTILKDRKKEIGPGLLHKMLGDLGLTLRDLQYKG